MTDQIIKRLLTDYPVLECCAGEVKRVIEEMIALYRRGGTFFCCGNGGSAADCDHICGELLKGFMSLRPVDEELKEKFSADYGEEGSVIAGKLQKGLPAVSLTSHPGYTTAFCNDVDPDLIFAQQLFAQAKAGDILLGISTGGGASNVRKAFMTARMLGVKTVLLTGNKHGRCEEFADIVIAAPERETYRIQELHLPIYHAICQAVEAEMFG
ncbi:MAG: SIS domain-containing protein [Lentisphaeria bacterium]|nr:SIS domain-containing protein [Lentisphaeria bacterium]